MRWEPRMGPQFLEWPCSRSLPGVKKWFFYYAGLLSFNLSVTRLYSVQYISVFQNSLQR